MGDKNLQSSLNPQLPEWKLRLAYFYAENKIVLKKAGVFLLFFFNLVIIFVFGLIFINYKTGLISDERQLSNMHINLVNQSAINKNKPTEIMVGDVIAVTNGRGGYNLMVMIKNNNQRWAVNKLDYTFVVNNQELPAQSTFILPQSEKQVMYFNVKEGKEAKFKIVGSGWMKIEDFSLLSYKDQIKINKAEFKQSINQQLTGKLDMEIYNDSPYGWWEVGLAIVLYGESAKVIGMDYLVINSLNAKETRSVTLSWHEPIEGRVLKVEVYPEINLLDKGVIMKIESPLGAPSGLE